MEVDQQIVVVDGPAPTRLELEPGRLQRAVLVGEQLGFEGNLDLVNPTAIRVAGLLPKLAPGDLFFDRPRRLALRECGPIRVGVRGGDAGDRPRRGPAEHATAKCLIDDGERLQPPPGARVVFERLGLDTQADARVVVDAGEPELPVGPTVGDVPGEIHLHPHGHVAGAICLEKPLLNLASREAGDHLCHEGERLSLTGWTSRACTSFPILRHGLLRREDYRATLTKPELQYRRKAKRSAPSARSAEGE